MTNQSRARDLIGYSFLVMFANDETIDENELAMLEKLALEDGTVDDEEREVLRNLFGRVDKTYVADKVWNEIERFRKENEI